MLAKVVLFDDPFREQGKGYFHILKKFEHCHQVEVFYIKAMYFARAVLMMLFQWSFAVSKSAMRTDALDS